MSLASLGDAAGQLEAAAKAISDLDALIQSTLTLITPTKPWQRKLLLDLSEAERHMQVLRMTIAMERPDLEVFQATATLLATLRAASVGVVSGRADQTTRHSLQVGVSLAQRLHSLLSSAHDKGAGRIQ